MYEFSREHEDWELDELFTLMIVSSFALILIVSRNAIHLKRENTKRLEAESAIKRMAFYDSLTGLPNRYLGYDRLEQAIEHAHRHKKMAAVLFIDLDNFKEVNDTYGHSCGDELLKQVSKRINFCLSSDDTLVRISGDEFIVIVEPLQTEDSIWTLAEGIIESMQSSYNLQGHEMFVSVSIGVAIYPTDGVTREDLLRNADAAMYHAKHQGKNTFKFFSPALDQLVRNKLLISNLLRQALNNDEFVLHYQPVFNINSKEIIGVEALLRWNNPVLGCVSPTDFIPVAEETGIIAQIGDWVLRQACKQSVAWSQAGLPSLNMSVNISALQLDTDDYASKVKEILDETGMNPCQLELELTETAVMKDVNKSIKTINALVDLGTSIAIDDFGTGYSSISYLRKLNIHRIKIDRSFIKNIPENAEDIAIIDTIILLAGTLNLKITAEGVETEKQMSYIKSTTCECAQGFYFSPAVSAQRLVELIANSQKED